MDAITDSPIIIVAIDDNSLEQLGRFSSWPRSYHSQIIDILTQNHVRTIVFDILFSESSPDDEVFTKAMEEAGNVILPFIGDAKAAVTTNTINLNNFNQFLEPLEQFEAVALATGHANMIPDDDGIIRRIPLVIENNKKYEPSLALSTAAKYLRRSQIIESAVIDNTLTLAGRNIPLYNNNGMLINYHSNQKNGYDFPKISYVDVLNNNIDLSILQDKIALIGVTAIGFGDIFWTPNEEIKSGVEVHANAIYTLLSGNFLTPISLYQTDISIILMSVLCGLVVLRWRVLWSTLSVIILIFVYILFAFYYFDQGQVIDMFFPPIALTGVFVGTNLYNIASERREKREMANIFGKYVSPSVATQILQATNEGSLELGGEECTVTTLFADIRDFTKLSESIDSTKLVSIINQYLSVIIEAVVRHDGMVNKFGGDSIMAIWNVPINCPEHALEAVKAGIETQQSIKELDKQWDDIPKIEFGIGVNTGRVVAGNMGSIDRLEYSVMGDSVNVASRLANMADGGKVWIGTDTYDLVKDYVSCKPLAPLTLKGKRAQYQAYEIID